MAREVMPLIADQVALVIASELEHGDAVTGVRDATTGLFTEGYAAAWLAQTLAARRRTEIADREPLSIALFGIDAAEDADVGGPLAAEEKLQDLGRRVLHRMRASDVVWRQGSEIVAACPGATRDDVVAVAESVVRSLATRGGSASCARTASAGCASVDDDVHDPLPAVAMGLLMARHAGPGTVIPA
jgi:GGDEF domain-containing protein